MKQKNASSYNNKPSESSGHKHNLAMGMTLLQLAIRLSNSSEGIDAGNRDFQFSLVDKLGKISQYCGARRLSVSLGLDAIGCHRLKVDNGIDPFRSDTKLEGQFDVIGTECIDE